MKFEKTKVMNFEGAFRGMRNPKDSWNKSDSVFGLKILKSSDDIFDSGMEDIVDKWAEEKDSDINVVNKNDIREWLSANGILQSVNGGKFNVGECAFIGPADMRLAQTLIKGGDEHCKYLRQIFVSVDITAPFYFWKEFDTYKVGTVANSTSTMHKLLSKPITKELFETDDYHSAAAYCTEKDKINYIDNTLEEYIKSLNLLREMALDLLQETKNSRLSIEEKKEIHKQYKRCWKELVRRLPSAWSQKRTVTLSYQNLRSIIHQRSHHLLNEWSGLDDNSLDNVISWLHTLPYAEELLFYNQK